MVLARRRGLRGDAGVPHRDLVVGRLLVPLVHLPAVRLGDPARRPRVVRVRDQGARGDPHRARSAEAGGPTVKWLLAPYGQRRTYRLFLYLILGLPLGVLDFVLLVTGFSLGLGLLITLLGFPILVATLV